MTSRTFSALAAVALLAAVPLSAQQSGPKATDTAATADTTKALPPKMDTQPPQVIQNLRPMDRRGLNIFEAPKNDGIPYEGFRIKFGAAFTQQFQSLDHENTADAAMNNNVNTNELKKIGSGFNNAVANLYLDAQLAPGIRVAMTSYLSARHHQESWVKDGYLLVDGSPIDLAPLHKVMEYVTLRLGHFEINYGDAHFRRTDNGNAMYNPFVGNYILDAFTTEIGAEAYVRHAGFLAMAGATNGEIRGRVDVPERRRTAYLGKLGFDRQLTGDLRFRVTGSTYYAERSGSNTLYTGDRAGSRYYQVLENTAATEAAQAWSGNIRPGFANEVRAYVVNPFLKWHGLEYFGNIETAKGRAASEGSPREWSQSANELVYRFLADEKVYVGARYNTAKGALAGMSDDVTVERSQFGGGWFLTPSVLLKAEYVVQNYKDFPSTDIRSGGKFKGLVFEGVVAF
jgi:hypothetical protein